MSLKIEKIVTQSIATLPKKVTTLIIAYSGGLDSSVLLHLLASNLSLDRKVEVLHINHQLSTDANEWATHCQNQVKHFNLPCHVETVTVTKQNQGLEAAARKARYDIFERYTKSNCAILTAHHADDQVETVLQRILRGTGIRGLTGIPALRLLNQGYLLRPLLNITRLQLIQYATQHNLNYITDESNFDHGFTRNLLRHKILPALQQHFHDVPQQLLNLHANACDADELLTAYAETLYSVCNYPDSKQLNLTELGKFSHSQQRLILRYWLVDCNNMMAPSRERLDKIQRNLILTANDKQPNVRLGELLCRRYQQRLYLTPIDVLDCHHDSFQWDLKLPLPTPSGEIDPNVVREAVNLPENTTVTVRYRQGGERFHPAGRVGSHPLKKCLQEWNIPPWERNTIPLIYINNQLIYVYSYAVAEGWQVNNESHD